MKINTKNITNEFVYFSIVQEGNPEVSQSLLIIQFYNQKSVL